MEDVLKDTVYRQREAVARLLHEPIARLAEACVSVWGDRDQLNAVLLSGFREISACSELFIVNREGIQISDNVNGSGIDVDHFGRDRSTRPYMREAVPAWGFLLSDAYVSLLSRRPSLTALHVLRSEGELLGYVGASFDLRDLPVTGRLYDEPSRWVQIKGDPSIRGTVFMQSRAESPMDQNLAGSLSIMQELFVERGVFQGMIHFSSSRVTIWTVDDPFRYRILDHEALADPDICFAFPLRAYAKGVVIPEEQIGSLLNAMRELRLMDETFYLRSASINIFNGMIGLTFSCDGSHYMHFDEFLGKNLSFWIGSSAQGTAQAPED
jgi:hypothetical protein